MKLREMIKRAGDPLRPRRSPMHLLLVAGAMGVTGVCCYWLVTLATGAAELARPEIHGFASYSEPTKSWIVISLLLASIPVGLIAANALAWCIAPLRGWFEREAAGRPDEDFSSSMRGLLRVTKYWTPAFAAIGFAAAFLGS